jgi:hypothetical protein
MSERRYSDEEAAAIFARAADTQEVSRRRGSSSGGMTLAQLQEIGQEAGITPEAVAHAANSLARTPTPTARHFLGFPIGVGRTIELGRRLSDDEWERLVVDLRETFDARGRITAQGSFRQWTNGNLQALLEPTESGHRLRLKTLKANARMMMIGGLGALGFAAVNLITDLIGAGSVGPGELEATGTVALVGLAFLGAGAIRLPAWASLRRRQMDEVIARLTSTTAETTEPKP